MSALLASGVAAEVRLTLESAPAYALRHNPSLAAARLRIEEARGRLNQAGRLSNPEVELELNRNFRAPEGAVGVAFMQKFPLTARLRLEKAVTRAELTAAEAEVRNAERKLAAEVRSAAVKLLGLGGQKTLRERQLGNSRELSGFTRKRVETGEASLVDASLVELEAQQLQTEVLQLDVERSALIGDLRPLLGLAAGDAPVITGTLPGIGRLPRRGADLAARPDFEAARNTAEAARQSAALARAQKWEDIRAGLNVMEERSEDAPEGFERDTFVGLRFSLPLPLWNNNAGRIQEAAAAAVRAEKEIGAGADDQRRSGRGTRSDGCPGETRHLARQRSSAQGRANRRAAPHELLHRPNPAHGSAPRPGPPPAH
ncbi:MAG: TolC family protein [Verrucomicrobiota bacterium]|nr:TolC family protein [Verrucomicrobiota bacterium]